MLLGCGPSQTLTGGCDLQHRMLLTISQWQMYKDQSCRQVSWQQRHVVRQQESKSTEGCWAMRLCTGGKSNPEPRARWGWGNMAGDLSERRLAVGSNPFLCLLIFPNPSVQSQSGRAEWIFRDPGGFLMRKIKFKGF